MDNKDLKERLNAKINSYLSVGRQGGKDDEEWIREEDQIEMREDLYNFILELLEDCKNDYAYYWED